MVRTERKKKGRREVFSDEQAYELRALYDQFKGKRAYVTMIAQVG